jgi:type I restriction enzyme R subunit
VRKNVTIDWTLRENVRAQLRVLVRRILRKHGYPPDKQEKATQTVLAQAEMLSAELLPDVRRYFGNPREDSPLPDALRQVPFGGLEPFTRNQIVLAHVSPIEYVGDV